MSSLTNNNKNIARSKTDSAARNKGEIENMITPEVEQLMTIINEYKLATKNIAIVYAKQKRQVTEMFAFIRQLTKILKESDSSDGSARDLANQIRVELLSAMLKIQAIGQTK